MGNRDRVRHQCLVTERAARGRRRPRSRTTCIRCSCPTTWSRRTGPRPPGSRPAGTTRPRPRCGTSGATRSPAPAAHPDQLTDTDLGMANLILTNGARLYVDHAHPEYSGPEVTSALRRRPVRQGRRRGDGDRGAAGHPVTRPLGAALQEQHRRQGRVVRDPRELPAAASTPFDRVVTQFTAFLVTAPGDHRRRPGRASARRARRPGSRSASAPTSSRPRSVWRPRSTGRSSTPATSRTPTPAGYRRLHVITGDANLSEISTYLKVGTASWVLRVIEAGRAGSRPAAGRARSRAMRAVSHDLSLRQAADPARRPPADRGRPAGGLPGRLPPALRTDRRRADRGRPDRGQGHLQPLAGRAWTRCAPTCSPWPTSSTGWPSSS